MVEDFEFGADAFVGDGRVEEGEVYEIENAGNRG